MANYLLSGKASVCTRVVIMMLDLAWLLSGMRLTASLFVNHPVRCGKIIDRPYELQPDFFLDQFVFLLAGPAHEV